MENNFTKIRIAARHLAWNTMKVIRYNKLKRGGGRGGRSSETRIRLSYETLYRFVFDRSEITDEEKKKIVNYTKSDSKSFVKERD